MSSSTLRAARAWTPLWKLKALFLVESWMLRFSSFGEVLGGGVLGEVLGGGVLADQSVALVSQRRGSRGWLVLLFSD